MQDKGHTRATGRGNTHARARALSAFVLAAVIGSASLAFASEPDPASPDEAEVEALRTANSSTTELPDGTLQAEIYTEPIHFQASSGEWEEIESELVPSAEPGYALENEANSFTAYFPSDLAQEPVRVEGPGGESVSYALEGASGTPEADGETVTYEEAKPGIDLSYRMTPTGVEELIVLKTPAAADSYSFDLETGPGLAIEGEGAGATITDEAGAEPFEFVPPVAYDASGDTEELALELSGPEEAPKAEIAPDPEWLADAEYPVVVDPTIVVRPDTPSSLDIGSDCWIGEGVSGPSCQNNDGTLQVGRSDAGKSRHAILKFPVGKISEEALIQSASLSLYIRDPAASGPLSVSADRIDKDWERNNVTWVKRTSSADWNPPGGSFIASNPPVVTTVDLPVGQREAWNVTELVRKWVNPGANGSPADNHGMLLRPTTTLNRLASFASAEANDARRPQLTITYTSPLGLTLTAPNSYSMRVGWTRTPPAATDQFKILRKEPSDPSWRHIDTVTHTAGRTTDYSYVDYLLWRGTQYKYRVEAQEIVVGESEPRTLQTETLQEATSAVGTIPRMYAAGTFWNQTIEQAYGGEKFPPLQDATSKFANSNDMVEYSFVDPYTYQSNDGGAKAGPANFIANRKWGMSLVYADPASRNYGVTCTAPYDCVPGSVKNFLLPQYANLPHWDEAGADGDGGTKYNGARNDGSGPAVTDGKLAVINPVTNREFSFYEGSYTPSTDSWSSKTRYDSPGDDAGYGLVCAPGAYKCAGPTVSGFPNMAGVIRPEEVVADRGGIGHALNITSPQTRQGVIACPATNTSFDTDITHPYSTDTKAVPIGARVQLRLPAGYVIPDAWPPVVKRIAEALQTYGAYVNDRGGTVSIQGENDIGRGYPTWKNRHDDEARPINRLGKITADTGNSDEIYLDASLPVKPFPLEHLEVLKIAENTGPGIC